MRALVALLVALALFSGAPLASAQELLSGDSVVPWGCGWSPNGAYYQPCPAPAWMIQSYSQNQQATYPPPGYPSWMTRSYSENQRTYNPYADTSRIRIDLLPQSQAGWCARSYARNDTIGAVVWGC
jgi:hypothetical protein